MEQLGREMGWDGEKGYTWVLDLNQVLIQFPGSKDYGYSAKGNIYTMWDLYTMVL